jgi:hypothetical protein
MKARGTRYEAPAAADVFVPIVAVGFLYEQ